MGDRPIGWRRRVVSFIPPPQPDGTRLSEDTHWPYQFGAGIPPPFHPGDHAARTRERLRHRGPSRNATGRSCTGVRCRRRPIRQARFLRHRPAAR